MAYYVPGTEETDLKKVIMSLQQTAGNTATNTTNITTNTANIATNTTNIATNTANIATNTASIAAHEAAWTSFTPTITASSGTITSTTVAAHYIAIGKTVHIGMSIQITNNGTGAGSVIATLPVTPISALIGHLSGREAGVSGKTLSGRIDTSPARVTIFNYDNTYPGSTGAVIIMSGIYEAA